jgi:hypothetical protein
MWSIWRKRFKEAVFSPRLNSNNDADAMTSDGRPFQMLHATIGNTRSPIVERHVFKTTSSANDDLPAPRFQVHHTTEHVCKVRTSEAVLITKSQPGQLQIDSLTHPQHVKIIRLRCKVISHTVISRRQIVRQRSRWTAGDDKNGLAVLRALHCHSQDDSGP